MRHFSVFLIAGFVCCGATYALADRPLVGPPQPNKFQGTPQPLDRMELKSFAGYVADAGTYSDPVAGDPLVYGYHENIALALGLGFDPRDVTQYKRPCIDSPHAELDAGAVRTTLSISYVRNLDQMNLSMKVDSKADASYLGFKGGARFAMDTSYAFSANSITAVLTAQTDFGRWGLDATAKLNDDAKALLTDGAKFAEVCGTRFVIAERRGASVSAVITLRSVSDEFKSSFESEFSGGGSWGVMSASAQTKFALGLKLAAEQQRLDVQVGSTGGEGLAALKEGIKSIAIDEKDPLAKITQSLSGFLTGFTKENASPIEYTVASMKLFGWDPDSIDPWTDAKETSLRKIVKLYRRAALESTTLVDMEAGKSPFNAIYPKSLVDFMVKQKGQVDSFASALAIAHKDCKADTQHIECLVPDGVLTGIDFSLLDPPAILFYMKGFTEQETRLVLNSERGARLNLAKQFHPVADGIGATLNAYRTPADVVAWREVFKYSDGTESASNWSAGPFFFVWFREPNDGKEKGWEDQIWDWFSQHDGDFSGTEIVEIEDRTSRRFRIAFYKASWTAHGGKISRIVTETLM